MVAIFLDYDQEQLDLQYDQNTLIKNVGEYAQACKELSVKARKILECTLDVPYGEATDQVLDYFPALTPLAPIQILIHGGAWTRGDKSSFSFPACHFLAAEIGVVVPNFTLAPAASLDEMVAQNRAVVSWVYHNAEKIDGDRNQMYLTGFSSGSHIAAMLLCTPWQSDFGLPDNVIKGATLLSGIYELHPVQLSYRNSYLRLDHEAVEKLSPIRHIPDHTMPLVVGCGTRELIEFQRQTHELELELENKNYPIRKVSLIDHNHFDVLKSMNDANSAPMRATLDMIKAARN